MARLDYVIGVERRPCYVGGKKAMFHTWMNRAQVMQPSMMVGGQAGGQLWEVFGMPDEGDETLEAIHVQVSAAIMAEARAQAAANGESLRAYVERAIGEAVNKNR